MHLDGLRLERAIASTQFRDGLFHNTAPVGLGLQPGKSKGVVRKWLFDRKGRRPPAPLPVQTPLDAWTKSISTGLRVTWLGHSTMLLEMDGLRVLTDPVFGNRLGPIPSLAGPKRFHAPPVTVAQLPKLDAVLVSHDHYDHLCATTMRQLAALRVPVITSLGVGVYLQKFGVDPALIVELDWNESHVMAGGTLKFTATPSQHFSGRLDGGRNRTLWSSWVIKSDKHNVFFSGDTGLTPQFADVGAAHGPFDLVMLEIGAWHPAWGTIHLGPENALTVFEMLGGGTLMPVHWSTFDLGIHPWSEPAETLVTLAETRGARIVTPMLGQVFEPSLVEGVTPWWRGLDGPAVAHESSKTTGAVSWKPSSSAAPG